MPKTSKKKKEVQEVEDQDFLLYNDKQDEREAIESLGYRKDSYVDAGSGWDKFYD